MYSLSISILLQSYFSYDSFVINDYEKIKQRKFSFSKTGGAALLRFVVIVVAVIISNFKINTGISNWNWNFR
ncbi:hypothetical protein [Polaribacter sp. HL-MS24]|uniref:hypothetical protein n=1 Tax=Polaribacter sp. HL-MS24 TaxID=3077735 RepID=UPI002934F68E|nr:hypothetical protein [Polaribacter sp. HL-MS24]WOC40633.1 hypothetical protein RRF69_02255 [Polaribacter sp. HL-MS24]